MRKVTSAFMPMGLGLLAFFGPPALVIAPTKTQSRRSAANQPQEGAVELNLSPVGVTSASGHEQPTEAEPILRLLIFKFQTETLRTSWILQDALHNAACIIRRESIDEDRSPEASCPHPTAAGDY